jgi:hypothetical protein
MYDGSPNGLGWHGYADAKPSESIQKHELPGIAVAVVFPYLHGDQVLYPPVKQFKDYKPRVKGSRAREFADWLQKQKSCGFTLRGFFHAHHRNAAAALGLDLIQELPDTHVEKHHDKYRLFFGKEYIDFAQAVALEYYFFTISFGILRAGMSLPASHRKLFLAMDRFPGRDTEGAPPGTPLPPTQGAKLLEFIRRYSETGIGIEKKNASANLQVKLGTIDGWKRNGVQAWEKGKTHPSFTIADWLAAAAIAHAFPGELANSFEKEKEGQNALDGLRELYAAFKSFDLWSMEANVLPYIRAETKIWEVPQEARDFILERAKL